MKGTISTDFIADNLSEAIEITRRLAKKAGVEIIEESIRFDIDPSSDCFSREDAGQFKFTVRADVRISDRELLPRGVIEGRNCEICKCASCVTPGCGDEAACTGKPFEDCIHTITECEDHKPPMCSECGEILSQEQIGVNVKMGAHEESQYKCYPHLGITDEDAQSLIDYYKSTGCTLF